MNCDDNITSDYNELYKIAQRLESKELKNKVELALNMVRNLKKESIQ